MKINSHKEIQNGLAMYHLGYTYGQIGHKDEEIYFYEMAIYVFDCSDIDGICIISVCVCRRIIDRSMYKLS